MKPGRFILWQPINFEILACSSFFILLLSFYIFWIRNKQKRRITWQQMHWFLVEQSSTNLKTYLLNIYVYKLSFCYFYLDEIYLLHENFHELSQEGLYKVVLKIKILHVPVNWLLRTWSRLSSYFVRQLQHYCFYLVCFSVIRLDSHSSINSKSYFAEVINKNLNP